MKYSKIFEPVIINKLEIKNRILMPAIHLGYTLDGYINERLKEFYFRRATGGVGMAILGGCKFDSYGGMPGMPDISQDKYMDSFMELTEGIHERGSKIAIQLYHAGRYNSRRYLEDGLEPLAPSAVYSSYSREVPREITKEEIKCVIVKCAEAAIRAKKVGFDAIEISGSAGYLISQFLSPVTNIRDDEYGGSWENRCRFSRELVRAVRSVVGSEYPILMRISGNDFVEGSNTNDQAVEFSKILEQEGIDAINVTGGWHETKIPQLTGEVSRGGYTYLARAIKNAVNIPVIASNRINDPYTAEMTLALGNADMVNVGRGMIADPDWCKKAQENRVSEIRHCVACNQGCLAKVFFGKPAECLVNGSAGQEYLLKIREIQSKKDILVVGSGVAGCEFAIKASELGHKVTIWEKESKIGGQLQIVSKPPAKLEFSTLLTYFESMLKKYNVRIDLNKEATVENLKAEKFDTVVIATGGLPKLIEFPQISDKIQVATASDVLNSEVIVGKDVVIVGGGSVGCETAQYLANEGSLNREQLYFLMANRAESIEKIYDMLNTSSRNVSIVEMQDNIGKGFEPGTGWTVLSDLKRLGVKNYSGSKIIEIIEGKIIIDKVNVNKETKEKIVKRIEIPCDSIVIATGYYSNNKLYQSINGKIKNVYNIGDSKQVGKISDAIRQAHDIAYEI